jgi:hypothetical protein
MHLELFLVRVLILCWGFEVFSPEAPAVFLREEYAGNVTPYRVLVVVQITSFLPTARGLEFPPFDWGAGILLP